MKLLSPYLMKKGKGASRRRLEKVPPPSLKEGPPSGGEKRNLLTEKKGSGR